MKHFEDCKEAVAKLHGFTNWTTLSLDLVGHDGDTYWYDEKITEAAEIYAKEMVNAEKSRIMNEFKSAQQIITRFPNGREECFEFRDLSREEIISIIMNQKKFENANEVMV